MLKKSLLTIAVCSVCLINSSIGFAEEAIAEHKMINGLRYYETMYNAKPSTEIMRLKMGSRSENVGGHNEDIKEQTEGLPMAFRPTVNKDEAWILDSINGALKLFKAGKLKRYISLKDFGGIIQDFAISKDNKLFAFLNAKTGMVYVTDERGKLKNSFPGYESALSIEFTTNNDLLIVSPLARGVVQVSNEGAPLGIYEADQSLSNFSTEKGLWGIDCFEPTKAKLYVRKGSNVKIVKEFVFDKFKDVEYKGGNIYGIDADGNVSFGLIACDSNGIIYRDRIYKCTQDGKVLKELDVIDDPILSPELPRHRIVYPDGDVMTFFCNELEYAIRVYSMK